MNRGNQRNENQAKYKVYLDVLFNFIKLPLSTSQSQ